jgi:large subunit ribosomal protein L6
LHGLSRALIANLVKGVTEGYSKKLELIGVGFKAANQGNVLDLSLGLFAQYHFRSSKGIQSCNSTGKRSEPYDQSWKVSTSS